MAGITGMGTTFNLPNYTGELFALTPEDTPLLSAIGGLTGGGMTTSTEFEWQTFDLRDPVAAHPRGGRDRADRRGAGPGNVKNVCQIHQEQVSVSYTKQAAIGQLASPQSAPFVHPGGGPNPVSSELNWQVEQALKQIALDVNWSFINGQYVLPTTNATAPQTQGLSWPRSPRTGSRRASPPARRRRPTRSPRPVTAWSTATRSCSPRPAPRPASSPAGRTTSTRST
jgi:hypothetical protein